MYVLGELRDLYRAVTVNPFKTMGFQQTVDGCGGKEFSSFRRWPVHKPKVKACLKHVKNKSYPG